MYRNVIIRYQLFQTIPGGGTPCRYNVSQMRVHGLIKKATDSHKYYLIKIGKETIIMAQKINELVMVPAYCY
ncbi:MAG TPA: hypothetical protein VFC67_22630 [Prolixibacteraceae bacterium]|nr:hypothetical protein [Prolixibacteraceae bacterium]